MIGARTAGSFAKKETTNFAETETAVDKTLRTRFLSSARGSPIHRMVWTKTSIHENCVPNREGRRGGFIITVGRTPALRGGSGAGDTTEGTKELEAGMKGQGGGGIRPDLRRTLPRSTPLSLERSRNMIERGEIETTVPA